MVTDTPYEDLLLIASDDDLTNTTVGIAARVRREERLRRALDALEAHTDYADLDYILLDSAPTESVLTHNVIGAADFLLIPVQTGGGAIEGVEPLLVLASEIHDSEKVPYRLLSRCSIVVRWLPTAPS